MMRYAWLVMFFLFSLVWFAELMTDRDTGVTTALVLATLALARIEWIAHEHGL